MSGSFCGFRRRPSRKRSLNSHDNSSSQNEDKQYLYEPRSLWAAMNNVGNGYLYEQETHADHHQLTHNNHNNNSHQAAVLTLEDWILSSPGFDKTNCINSMINNGEDEEEVSINHAHATKQWTRKIHPSFDGDSYLDEELLPRSHGRSLEVSNEGENRKIMMMKKKVRFRSPEVADIFVLPHHSPEFAHLW